MYSLRIHKESVSANRKQTKRITRGVIRHCADMRRNKGVDAFCTPYGGKAKQQINASPRKIRSHRMLLSLSEHKGLSRVSKSLSMLVLCLTWWPANKPAWVELWWILKHAARAVIRVV